MIVNPDSAIVVQPPIGVEAAWAAGWTPVEARLAVDAHKRGIFTYSWQLTIDVPAYPPIKAAVDQRLASPDGLPWTVDGASRAPGRLEREAAQELYDNWLERLRRSTLRDLAMMGFSVWRHPRTIDPDTQRTEIRSVERWPLAAVGYTPYPMLGVIGYYAIIRGGTRIQLPRPGTTDGDWTVVGEGDQPHLDGAICSLDVSFTAGQIMERARANLGKTMGRASPIGEMPPGTPLEDKNGQTPEAAAMQTVVAGLGTDIAGALMPSGAKITKFEVGTAAIGYFHESLLDRILHVALAVLGRGGALAKTDAQYQGMAELEVPEDLIRRDVRALERSVSALFALLARSNAGLGVETPRLNGHFPDTEQDARIKAKQEREIAESAKLAGYHAAVQAERANGFDFVGPDGQARLNAIAARCGVIAPSLPPQGLPPVLVKVPPTTTTLVPESEVPAPAGHALAAPTPGPGPAAKPGIAAEA